MDKKYDHKKIEDKIYKMWEEGDYFRGKIDPKKKPYTILLPLPNASGKMHTGNAVMIAIQDLLIRWKRMQGYSTLWVPGTDHAGFETQTTFEKKLKKEGKSRFDFDRNTLYKNIWDFVQENKKMIEQQIKDMGASIDWSRYCFTLDDKSLNTVMTTFEKMYKEGLVYKGDYVVNYSFKWGTTFSDAEIQYKKQIDPLYYMKYGPLTLATVRPETKFGDTAIAVHLGDKRYQKYIGKEIEVEGLLGKFKIKVIGDNYVDPEFGTGVVKVTPAHDKNDFEAGRRHNLEIKPIIGLDGKLNDNCGKYAGFSIKEARKIVVEDLKKAGLIKKIDEKYEHLVPVDYRSGDYIENLVLPNWFIKVEDIKKPALEAIDNGQLNIYPKWREITYRRWMENMHDWAISRQITWGIRIPVWYDVSKNPSMAVTFVIDSITSPGAGLQNDKVIVSGMVGELLGKYSFEQIESGLQSLIAGKDSEFVVQKDKPEGTFLQETDTFDTWFGSGQWPFMTLGYPDSEDFKYFYPTDVLETGWEIVTRWVSRMVMFGYYLTGKSPFRDVYLHGHVRALDGRKMSKSLGNVINPEDFMEEFGVDALRMGLIAGTANGKDFNFPRDKIIGYRNFANKIWNMARWLEMMIEKLPFFDSAGARHAWPVQEEDKEILAGLDSLIKVVNGNLEKYRFADAGEAIYQFMWHELADKYLEYVKNNSNSINNFKYIFTTCLKLLHPFMPFVTEEIWQNISTENDTPLIISNWPKRKSP